MKRRDILRSMAVTPLLGRFALPAPADANAAPLYREAAAKLPTLSDAETELIKNVAVTPLDASAKALVDRSAPSLDLLRQGAKAPRCVWGDIWAGDGYERLNDFWQRAIKLNKIALLRGRFEFEDQHSIDGISLAASTLTFGRHLGQIGYSICQLAGITIEHNGIAAAATFLNRLNRANLRSLLARFDALPEGITLRSRAAGARAYFLGYDVPHEKAKYDNAKISQELAWYDRLTLAAEEPSVFAALRESSNVEQNQLIDDFDALRLVVLPHLNVKRALFRAAITVVEDGPKAIGRVVDPFDGKPFDLRTWATGFELTSRFALEGKPKASLGVGHR